MQGVRNATGVIQQVISFFKSSAKRHSVLKSSLANHNLTQHTLTGLCETRWVERHDAVLQFQAAYAAIMDALDAVSQWSDRDTSSKAKCLTASIGDSEFIVSLYCLGDVISATLSLSESLQAKGTDLVKAAQHANSVLQSLKNRRLEAEMKFHEIFH